MFYCCVVEDGDSDRRMLFILILFTIAETLFTQLNGQAKPL